MLKKQRCVALILYALFTLSACGGGSNDVSTKEIKTNKTANNVSSVGGARAVCAVVYDYGWDAASNWFSTPAKGFCEQSDLNKICDTHVGTDIACTASDTNEVPWYQAAIDFAANKNGDGSVLDPNGRAYPVVALTRGTIKIRKALDAGWPEAAIGVHLQSGVELIGSPASSGQTLLKLDESWASNYRGSGKPGPILSTMVLASPRRVGDLPSTSPSVTVWIDSIAISGAVDATTSLPACKPYDKSNSWVGAGIKVFNARPDEWGASPTIVRNDIRQVAGNAIELGFYSPFIDSGANYCSNGDPLCRQAKVFTVEGVPKNPALIAGNTICGVGYGGVTVIGKNVDVNNNVILQVNKTWLSEAQHFGSTMGVSAGFVGSSDVTVRNNTIEGGDYGVGSDGSFPLFMKPSYYSGYWNEIVAAHPSFSEKYPFGAWVDGAPVFRDLDGVLANQVLLDLAGAKAAQRGDYTGFNNNLRIYGNKLTNSVVGISLFRANWSLVYENVVNETSPFTVYGASLVHTLNTFVYSNTFSWWPTAVSVIGKPGDVSQLGSAYNGIGIRPPFAGDGQWSYPGNNYVGNGQNVVIDAGEGNNSFPSCSAFRCNSGVLKSKAIGPGK